MVDKNVKSVEDKVQAVVDEETDKGFRGVEVDTTDNFNYTVAGVVAGKPVPEAEADPKAAQLKASQRIK